MAKGAKMDEDELINFIESRERQATGFYGSEVAQDQATAMDYYQSKPFGTEEEGRSQVISSDVFDVVEGMTPIVAKPFVSSDDVVKFIANGPQDVDQAQQETDYVNFVATQRNDSFEQLIAWIKTGLLQKNGVVKYWWDVTDRTEIERYYDLSDDMYALLLQDGGETVQVLQHSEKPGPPGPAQMGPNGPIPGEPTMLHDVVLKTTQTHGEAKYAVIPPEEFLIASEADSINPKKARFVQHRPRKTLSELRDMGYDVDDDLSDTGTEDPTMSPQYLARRNSDEIDWRGDNQLDPASREVIFRETYVNVDFDGDGIAELRKVCLVGRKVLDNDETEEIPFAAWTPYQQAFKFYGKCPADETTEIQLVKSTLIRQTMDNVYTINNNRTYANDDVNIDDLLDNQIAGVVRVKGTGNVQHAVAQAEIQPIGSVTMPLMEYFDAAKENRTGFSRYNQGSQDLGNQKTLGEVQIVSEMSGNRTDLISRSFAETGLKQLMLGLHGLIRRHGSKAETVQLRGNWVTIDPRDWKTRYDMNVSVGLGATDKRTQMQAMQTLMAVQGTLAQGGTGIVTPKNLYNSAAKFAETVGEKNPTEYFTPPPDQPQPPPDPRQNPEFILKATQVQHEEAQIEIDRYKAETERMKVAVTAQGDAATAAALAAKAGIDDRAQLFDALSTLKQQSIDLQAQMTTLGMQQNQQNHQQALDMHGAVLDQHAASLQEQAQAHAQQMAEAQQAQAAQQPAQEPNGQP